MLVSSGVEHVIVSLLFFLLFMRSKSRKLTVLRSIKTMDLHASQIQGFFDVPVDKYVTLFGHWHLKLNVSLQLVCGTYHDSVSQGKHRRQERCHCFPRRWWREAVSFPRTHNPLCSTEAHTYSCRASSLAARLDLDFALFHKERKKANEVARMVLVGNVQNKTAVLIDDMADTCGTLIMAANRLVEAGATNVIALVTHGILSGPAFERLEGSGLERLIVTNTIPQTNSSKQCSKVHMVDISHVLAETIRRSHYGESISYLSVHLCVVLLSPADRSFFFFFLLSALTLCLSAKLSKCRLSTSSRQVGCS